MTAVLCILRIRPVKRAPRNVQQQKICFTYASVVYLDLPFLALPPPSSRSQLMHDLCVFINVHIICIHEWLLHIKDAIEPVRQLLDIFLSNKFCGAFCIFQQNSQVAEGTRESVCLSAGKFERFWCLASCETPQAAFQGIDNSC